MRERCLNSMVRSMHPGASVLASECPIGGIGTRNLTTSRLYLGKLLTYYMNLVKNRNRAVATAAAYDFGGRMSWWIGEKLSPSNLYEANKSEEIVSDWTTLQESPNQLTSAIVLAVLLVVIVVFGLSRLPGL